MIEGTQNYIVKIFDTRLNVLEIVLHEIYRYHPCLHMGKPQMYLLELTCATVPPNGKL